MVLESIWSIAGFLDGIVNDYGLIEDRMDLGKDGTTASPFLYYSVKLSK